MEKAGTDKKLELVKAIRIQNHQDRQLIRFRENLLYGEEPAMERGEIYGLESAAISFNKKQEKAMESGKASLPNRTFGSFRIRFFLAVILLAAFIVCDRAGYSYKGKNTDTIFERMVESIEIPSFLQYNENARSGK